MLITKEGQTPEGERITILAGEEGESHDCSLREKGFCVCANGRQEGFIEQE